VLSATQALCGAELQLEPRAEIVAHEVALTVEARASAQVT